MAPLQQFVNGANMALMIVDATMTTDMTTDAMSRHTPTEPA